MRIRVTVAVWTWEWELIAWCDHMIPASIIKDHAALDNIAIKVATRYLVRSPSNAPSDMHISITEKLPDRREINFLKRIQQNGGRIAHAEHWNAERLWRRAQ